MKQPLRYASALVAVFALAYSPILTPEVSAGLLDKLDKVTSTGVKVVKAQKGASLDDEKEMGKNLSAMILGAFPPAGSEALNQYVTKVGLTVVAASDRPELPYYFQVVEARDSQGAQIANAFSTPGGYIFITRGLLAQLKSEAELAGVLGHEIAHIAEKHALKAIKKQKTMGALTEMGAQVAAEHTSGIAREFAAVIGPAFVNNLFEKGFDRADEYKADAAAARYASKAGYDPKGLITFLHVIESKEGGRNYSTILRTHPKPQDRIGRLEKLISSKKLSEGKKQILGDRWKATVGKL